MNDINYFEVGTPDVASSKKFYGNMFGWNIADTPSAQGYRTVNDGAGGLWDTSAIGEGNWAIFYVQVKDVHAAIQKAEELGGHIAVPYTDGGGIEFAHILDPQGNRFGIWRPKVNDAPVA